MMKLINLAAALLCVMTFAACDDTTDKIGPSLIPNGDNLIVDSASYNVTTRSIMADSVLSSGAYCYLGRIDDPETNTKVTSSYTTQFHIIEYKADSLIAPKDSIVSKNAAGQIIADSCYLTVYFNSSVGDSLNPMTMKATLMNTTTEEGKYYYTDFDPESDKNDAGSSYVVSGAMSYNKTYTTNDLNIKDSLRTEIQDGNAIGYTRIALNKPYKGYNNYGSYLMNEFYNHPAYFKNSYRFAKYVCPGFYVKCVDGLGVMSEIYATQLTVDYRYLSGDSVVKGAFTLYGNEEVMQTNHISYNKTSIQKMINDNTCTYLKTPAGIFTEVTLPVDDILNGHENDSISLAQIIFTKYNPETESTIIKEPTTILMMPKDSLYTFFEKKSIYDSKTSFAASSSSTVNTYTFNNISSLITTMKSNKGKSDNWNKAVLVPVTIKYTTSSTTSTITGGSNNMSLTSAKLIGGSANPQSPIKILINYARFK